MQIEHRKVRAAVSQAGEARFRLPSKRWCVYREDQVDQKLCTAVWEVGE